MAISSKWIVTTSFGGHLLSGIPDGQPFHWSAQMQLLGRFCDSEFWPFNSVGNAKLIMSAAMEGEATKEWAALVYDRAAVKLNGCQFYGTHVYQVWDSIAGRPDGDISRYKIDLLSIQLWRRWEWLHQRNEKYNLALTISPGISDLSVISFEFLTIVDNLQSANW